MSYVVGERSLIDAGDFRPEYTHIRQVLLTHCHMDHIYGLNRLLESSHGTPVYTNEYGRQMLLDAKKNLSYYNEAPFVFNYPDMIRTVSDGQEIVLAEKITARAIFTPGHSPSCISWMIEDALFTGDSYIPGLKTVTNLPGGDKTLAAKSELLIKGLAKEKCIFPGHKV